MARVLCFALLCGAVRAWLAVCQCGCTWSTTLGVREEEALPFPLAAVAEGAICTSIGSRRSSLFSAKSASWESRPLVVSFDEVALSGRSCGRGVEGKEVRGEWW